VLTLTLFILFALKISLLRKFHDSLAMRGDFFFRRTEFPSDPPKLGFGQLKLRHGCLLLNFRVVGFGQMARFALLNQMEILGKLCS
jgi:hypothetical protein